MICDKCKKEITPGDEMEHLCLTLCEDCCMIAMSPVKTCDPWAVHSAKSLERISGKNTELTQVQAGMLKILKEKGPMEPKELLTVIGSDLTMPDLEREFASLRHMEKVRGEKMDMKIYWRLW